jgi:hypothetical protein
LNDQVAPVHVTLGLIDQGISKYADAVKEFQRAAELDSAVMPRIVGWRLHTTHWARLRKLGCLQKAIEMRKDYWGGYSALGVFTQKRMTKPSPSFVASSSLSRKTFVDIPI